MINFALGIVCTLLILYIYENLIDKPDVDNKTETNNTIGTIKGKGNAKVFGEITPTTKKKRKIFSFLKRKKSGS